MDRFDITKKMRYRIPSSHLLFFLQGSPAQLFRSRMSYECTEEFRLLLFFRGKFDGRDAAVKRILPDCFSFADREV